MGFLKRLFGTTDALVEVRKRVESHEAPPGWSATPDVTQTDDEVIVKINAPGLDASSVEHEIEDGALVLKAHGTTKTGAKIVLNERLKLSGVGDLDQADVSYDGETLAVRIPKSPFGPQSSA